MADTRHRTVIELAVDDRQLKNLDKTISRAFDPKSIDRFEKMLDRTTRAMNVLFSATVRMAKAQQELAKVQSGGGGRGGGGGSGSPPPSGGGGGKGISNNDISQLVNAINRMVNQQQQGGGQPSWANRTSSTAVGTWLGNAAGKGAGMGAGMVGGSAMQSMSGAIPYIGGAISGIMQSIDGLHQEFASQKIAESRTLGATGRATGGFRGGAIKYGVGGAESPGMLAEIANQSATTGKGLTDPFALAALRAQMVGGISGAAGIVGAGKAAGGDVKDPTKLMMQAVSAGVRAGVEETRLSEYMSNVSSWAQQSRDNGFMLEPQSILEMVNGFANANVRGMRAVELAKSVSQGLRGAGKGGSFADILALQSAGYGSGTSYYDARDKLESNDPETFKKLVGSIKGSTNQKEGQLKLLETVLGQLGIQKSIKDMKAMLGYDTSALGTADGEGFLNQREKDLKGGFGVAAGEAAYAQRRAGVGGKMGKGVRARRGVDLEFMERTAPLAAKAQEAAANTIMDGIKAFDKGGMGGLVGWSATFMVQLGDRIVSSIKEGFGIGKKGPGYVDTFNNVVNGDDGPKGHRGTGNKLDRKVRAGQKELDYANYRNEATGRGETPMSKALFEISRQSKIAAEEADKQHQQSEGGGGLRPGLE